MYYNARRLVIELSEGGGVLVLRSRVVPSYVYRVTVKILYTTTGRNSKLDHKTAAFDSSNYHCFPVDLT